jgi:hypothetical protein
VGRPAEPSGQREICASPSDVTGLALVRLAGCRDHAVRRPSTALRQLRLYSLRLLFHSYPAQFSNQLDELVRLLPRRHIGGPLLFGRRFHGRFSSLVFLVITCCTPLQRSRNEGHPLFIAYVTDPERGSPRGQSTCGSPPRFASPSSLKASASNQARAARFRASPSLTMRGEAGNCSTVAC